MTKETIMACYQAPIFQHYKKVMAFILNNSRKNGVEVPDEEWKRTADGLLKEWTPNALDSIKAMMYAWGDYLKKTL